MAIAGSDGFKFLGPQRVRCERCKAIVQLGRDFDTSNFKKHHGRCLSSAQAKAAREKGQMDLNKMLLAASSKKRKSSSLSGAGNSTDDSD